jgi:predicted enzyme related to lactoylglutathione lyase
MNRFTHFELVTDDREKTAAFYRAVFGWKVEKWAGPVDYWIVDTGDASTPGINGGLMQAGGDFSGTVNTVEVEDIDAVLAKVKGNGGTIIFEKSPVPGVGQLAYFKDNCGIVVGVMQPDPNASM